MESTVKAECVPQPNLYIPAGGLRCLFPYSNIVECKVDRWNSCAE